MDNLLVQVTGKKRVVLFSPRDASYLYLSGDKSQVLDIDQPNLETYPLFAHATRHECLLEAGDVLFSMKPPAKNEGNSRQRRLGWPFRVASIRHRTREVVCRVSCG